MSYTAKNKDEEFTYFRCSIETSKSIVAVHMKPLLRSIERIVKETRKGADGHRSYEFLYERPGGGGGERRGDSEREWGRKGEVKPS